MSHLPPSTPEEPKAFIIWNQRLAAAAAAASTPGSASSESFSFVYDDDVVRGGADTSGEFSSFSAEGHHILPINESGGLEELESSELKLKGPLYNIIQNKMNLSEKRGPKFLCQECRYPVHTRLSMVTHMKMHLRPFCEACFSIFDSQDAVHTHIRATHPEVLLGEAKDFYCMQTVAPPNTPTPLSDDEMKTIEGLVNPIVKYPFSFQHQQEETEGEATNEEDEPRLVIDDGPRPRGRPRKSQQQHTPVQQQQPIVKKSLKKKKVKKIKIVEDTTPDNVMKKITSRFGRSISLKMPQF